MSADNPLNASTSVHPSEEQLIAQAQKHRKIPHYVYRVEPIVSQKNMARTNSGTIPRNPITQESIEHQVLPEVTAQEVTPISVNPEVSKRALPPMKPVKFNANAKRTFYATLSTVVTVFLGALVAIYFGHKALREIKISGEQGQAETILCLAISYFVAFPFVGLACLWFVHLL